MEKFVISFIIEKLFYHLKPLGWTPGFPKITETVASSAQ